MILILWGVFGVLLWRILMVFRRTGRPLGPRNLSFKTLVVLGSGGHTAEMLNLLEMLKFQKYTPRCYVAAATDNMSLLKARAMEENSSSRKSSRYYQVYRSREVGQSYITSVFTTLVAMAHAFWIVFRIRPDVVLCNGPGTCLPVCIAALLLKILGLRWVVLVYVESIARVQKLSLTGLLLYKLRIMDQFYVQWPQLKHQFPRTQYVGRLM